MKSNSRPANTAPQVREAKVQALNSQTFNLKKNMKKILTYITIALTLTTAIATADTTKHQAPVHLQHFTAMGAPALGHAYAPQGNFSHVRYNAGAAPLNPYRED